VASHTEKHTLLVLVAKSGLAIPMAPMINTTLQHTSRPCITLQFVIMYLSKGKRCQERERGGYSLGLHAIFNMNCIMCCNTWQRIATHCNTLQCIAKCTGRHCDPLQHTATRCKALQHTATHYKTVE